MVTTLTRPSREHGSRPRALAGRDPQSIQLRTALDELAQERRRHELAEAQSARALAFMDAEIREAHHRVKNTIQVAASMLQLQARATASIQVRAALQESHDRLRLLAAVHELLQRNKAEEQVILMPELLAIIGDALKLSFSNRSPQVRLSIAADPMMLPADQALSVALLANEAMTNSYKHAFPDDRCGELAVTLRHAGEYRTGLFLQISDNGVGLDPSAIQERGLGMALIDGFASQLSGIVTLSAPADGRGTIVTLTIASLLRS